MNVIYITVALVIDIVTRLILTRLIQTGLTGVGPNLTLEVFVFNIDTSFIEY